ncbi:MAG: OmpA family protein [Gemmatimonadales bacterium]
MRLTLPISLGITAILIATACGGGPPPEPVVPQPDPDSIARERARADSIAAERARVDSLRRVREREERVRRQRTADSLAAIRRETEAVREMLARRVHFDFDKSAIRPGEDTEVLEQKLAILQANPGLTIEITGHCDERGTDQYNIALGNRRAVSARKFLTDHGISESRITVRSMGEEQPVDPGHTEEAWAQNRRSEFTITGGGSALKRPGM